MFKNLFHTKFIVIIGYFVLVCVSAVGIILIYMELLKYSEINEPPVQRKELVIIGNTLATMYQAEGTASLLTVALLPELKHEYDSLMNNVLIHISSLKEISNEPELNLHLDSVVILLNQKQINTRKMVQLLDSIENKTIKEVTKTTVLSKKDLSDLNRLLVKKTQEFGDTTVVISEKKKFWQRVGDVFNSDSKDSTTQISKNVIDNFGSVIVPVLTDTVAEYINEIFSVAQKRNASTIRRLVARQSELYRTNEMLTTQINQVMRDIENREHLNTLNMIREREETLKRSSRIVSFIGLLALIMTIIFLFWTLHSISVGQRLQKEIEKAKKYAENLLSSRERLLLTITHDIKAPISSIIGYIELLLKNRPPKKESYYIENMQHSAEHVLELVRNLLDYHALDSSKQKINQMSFSPCVLITDIYESFIPLADKKELKFSLECAIKKDTNCSSDPYRIRQIVSNLLSNAIKFTPPKGLVVLSALIRQENDQATLILSISDSGPGITDEDKASVFEEFRRLDRSSREGIEGSGLGLAITQKLSKLLGGTIEIESRQGKGSDFTVKIPLKPSRDKAATNISDDPVWEEGYLALNVDVNKKILFIDDDVIQLNLFSELLKQEGFSPVVCSNSTEALELLQKTHFDIVFSDIQMPGMNGFELVERIRMATFDESSFIPVVALSASSDISEQKFMEAGFSGFLAKPFTANQLFNIIRQFINNDICRDQLPSDGDNKGFNALIKFAPDDKIAAIAIIQSFVDENKKNMETLTCAFKKEDWETIKHISHKMLPIMRMISAGKLVSILYEYEKGNQMKEKETNLLFFIETQVKAAESFIAKLKKN